MSNSHQHKSGQLDRQVRRADRPTSRPASDLKSQRRLAGVLLILGVGSLGLLLRLVWLQIVDAPNLGQKARAQQTVTIRPFVPRRTIVDRSNNQIAIDRPSYTMYAHPNLFNEVIFDKKDKSKKSKKGISSKIAPADMAQRLAPILADLGWTQAKLLVKFQQKPSGVLIGSGLREDTIDRIRALKLDGLDIRQGETDYQRVYPQEQMLASVLGYLDGSRKPGGGVELSQSAILERKVTQYPLTKEARGDILPDRVTTDFLHTDDLKLQLSIDLRLQRAATAALTQQIKAWNATRGTVIVMDADTGALRSLVVYPTYDPNHYNKDLDEYRKIVGPITEKNGDRATLLLQNWAVSDPIEPGSTFKPINIAIALETGAIKPTTIINDPGSIVVYKGTPPIRNSHLEKYGDIDIAKVLQVSSNVGMVKIMDKLKPNTYYNWIQRIGLGQRYGIDLPDEGRGFLHDRQYFANYPYDRANNSFGQGFTLTSIQLVTLMASLANGGKLVTPHVVEGLFDSSGTRKDKPTLPEPRQIFSPTTTKAVLEMMETVVSHKEGTGKLARIPGYRIAGKTGTAEKGNYKDKNKKLTSFVGILPVGGQHRYVVFAAIDEPYGKEKAFGSIVAAPVVKSVMESLISIEGIPPSDPSQVGKEPQK